jgi:hypothetical protein
MYRSPILNLFRVPPRGTLRAAQCVERSDRIAGSVRPRAILAATQRACDEDPVRTKETDRPAAGSRPYNVVVFICETTPTGCPRSRPRVSLSI